MVQTRRNAKTALWNAHNFSKAANTRQNNPKWSHHHHDVTRPELIQSPPLSQYTLPWCACRAAPVTLLLRVVSQMGALVKMITPPCLRELTRSSPSHHRDVTRADPIRSLSQCTWPCCTCRAAPVTFCTSIALECSGISGVEENVFYVLKGYLFEWDVSRASPPLCSTYLPLLQQLYAKKSWPAARCWLIMTCFSFSPWRQGLGGIPVYKRRPCVALLSWYRKKLPIETYDTLCFSVNEITSRKENANRCRYHAFAWKLDDAS